MVCAALTVMLLPRVVLPAALSSPTEQMARIIETIDQGKLKSGLLLLRDFLRDSTEGDTTHVTAASRLTTQLFFPEPEHKSTIPALTPGVVPKALSSVYFHHVAEKTPVTEKWRAIWFHKKPLIIPQFSYSWSFILAEPWQLLFALVPVHAEPLLNLTVAPAFDSLIMKPMVFKPNPYTYDADVKIVVDCNPQTTSLFEYMHDIVGSEFDRVVESHDLQLFGAVSLRCYNQSVFRNIPGQFRAFVVFDQVIRPKGKKYGSRERVAARYVIAVRSSQAVEEKARAIMDDICMRILEK